MKVPINKIYEDVAFNSRDAFTQRSVEELADLLHQYGQQYKVDVQPASDCEIPDAYDYRLLAGYRRIAAAKLLGWTEIDVELRTGFSESEAADFNFIENVGRQQLTPVEEAKWLQRRHPGKKPREIAKATGQSLFWVHRRLKILRLPDIVQSAIATGKLPLAEVDRLANYDTDEQMLRAFEKYMQRTCENKVTAKRKTGLQRRKTKAEIIAMADRLIREGLQGLSTKALIWAAGCIDDVDLEFEIKNAKERR